MDDATLARLEHENLLEWLRIHCSQVAGALIRIEEGVGVFASGVPKPLFNQVVTNDGATDAAVDRAVEEVRARGVPFCVVLRRGPDDHFAARVLELGLRYHPDVMPGLALNPIPSDVEASDVRLDIRVVDDETGLRDHIATAARGFDIPVVMVGEFVGRELWLRPDCTVYVGTFDGKPVTSGMAVRTGGTIGLYMIATIPEARGRGFGDAITRRLLTDAAAAGCEVAALTASDMGRPIYERIGFRLVLEYDIYVG
jgi:ribosomal protein S18 acetylase RimI-like enzyme